MGSLLGKVFTFVEQGCLWVAQNLLFDVVSSDSEPSELNLGFLFWFAFWVLLCRLTHRSWSIWFISWSKRMPGYSMKR